MYVSIFTPDIKRGLLLKSFEISIHNTEKDPIWKGYVRYKTTTTWGELKKKCCDNLRFDNEYEFIMMCQGCPCEDDVIITDYQLEIARFYLVRKLL